MGIEVRQFSSDKILKHLDRVTAWLQGENPSPITLELDLTNVCNHRCPECSGWHFPHKNYDSLPLDLAKDIIQQLAKAKVRGLIFTGGGEPLCYPHIKELLEMSYKSGLEIGFITNGSLINPEIAEVLLKCCRWVRISLDANVPSMFKKTHGLDGDSFYQVIENIKLLVQAKLELRSQTTIGIGYLTCDYTKDQLYDMTILCKQLGVDYLQFRPMQIHDNGKSKYHLTDINEKVYHCMKESTTAYKVLYSKHKYDMMREPNFGRNYGKCFGQQFATVIAADSRMYICCHMRGNQKYCIGDLKKNTFAEIWNSEQRKKVIENIDFSDCIHLCRDNTFNQVLWNIKQDREHANFL